MKKEILIVEDDDVLSLTLSDNLTKEGFKVKVAKNGEEGLSLVLSTKPDLILLDIIMPKMDGMMMLEKLRDDDWGKNAKVIILTNVRDVKKISEAVTKGSYEYLVKSDWELEDIITRIKERLNSI